MRLYVKKADKRGTEMKCKTKNRLSQEKIRELVRIHFGQDCKTGKITELNGGMFNAIYRIERIKEKDAIILKVGVIPGTTLLTYERDIMLVEVECYRMIHEQTTVPVPECLDGDLFEICLQKHFLKSCLGGEITYKKLGKTGMDMSPICLGCMGFGDQARWPRPWLLDREKSTEIVKEALRLGVNWFDTANMYSLGASEEYLGYALKKLGAHREELVIQTKVNQRMGLGPNREGNSRKEIMFEIDESRKSTVHRSVCNACMAVRKGIPDRGAAWLEQLYYHAEPCESSLQRGREGDDTGM